MHLRQWIFACAILTGATGPALAGQTLELVIDGQRDWDWNALMNTTHGPFAFYAALGKAFTTGMKIKYTGPAWEKDKLHAPLIADGGGKFSGQGAWDAETLWPAGTLSSQGISASVQYKTPLVIKNLKPVVHASLDRATGRMNVDLDLLLRGPATGGAYTGTGNVGGATGHMRGSVSTGAYNSDVDVPDLATGKDRVGSSGGTSTFQAKGELASELAKQGMSPTQTKHVAPPPKVDQPAYIHLHFSVAWKDGAMIPVKGHDEYGNYNYTVRVHQAAFIPPPPPAQPQDDRSFCIAGVITTSPRLNRQHVADQCGCFVSRIRTQISPADYDVWRRIMEITGDTRSSDSQKSSEMMAAMSQAPADWEKRFDAADKAAERACHITDWD